jgi:hypothetical protein
LQNGQNGLFYSETPVSLFYNARCLYFLANDDQKFWNQAGAYYAARPLSAIVLMVPPNINQQESNAAMQALNAFNVGNHTSLPVYFLFNSLDANHWQRLQALENVEPYPLTLLHAHTDDANTWAEGILQSAVPNMTQADQQTFRDYITSPGIRAFAQFLYGRGLKNISFHYAPQRDAGQYMTCLSSLWRRLLKDLKRQTADRWRYMKDRFFYYPRQEIDHPNERSSLRKNLVPYENIYLDLVRLRELLEHLRLPMAENLNEADWVHEQSLIRERMENYAPNAENLLPSVAKAALDYERLPDGNAPTRLERIAEKFLSLKDALSRCLALIERLRTIFDTRYPDRKENVGCSFWYGFNEKGEVMTGRKRDLPEDWQLNYLKNENDEIKRQIFHLLFAQPPEVGNIVETFFWDTIRSKFLTLDIDAQMNDLQNALATMRRATLDQYFRALLSHQTFVAGRLRTTREGVIDYRAVIEGLNNFFEPWPWRGVRNLWPYKFLDKVFIANHPYWGHKKELRQLYELVQYGEFYAQPEAQGVPPENQQKPIRAAEDIARDVFLAICDSIPPLEQRDDWLSLRFLLSLRERVEYLYCLTFDGYELQLQVRTPLTNWREFLNFCITGEPVPQPNQVQWQAQWPFLGENMHNGAVVRSWPLVRRLLLAYDRWMQQVCKQEKLPIELEEWCLNNGNEEGGNPADAH